ncbi:MAG: PH domain-containing protein [Patescibacteria group bacterium]|mgnify:FL=1
MLNLSFLIHSQYTFEGKKPYEHVVALLYRHWFVLAVKIILFLLFLILPFIVYGITGSYLSRAGLTSAFWFVIAAYLCAWWYGLFYQVTMYLLDVWIVTDHRIIDSQQHGFFNRTLSELNLAKIQDISVLVKGGVPTLLDFGNLEIQSAGAENRFLFEQIPNPYRIKDLVMKMHNQYIAQHKDEIEIHESEGI